MTTPHQIADERAGFRILDSFRRFSQRDDVFSRSFWDPTVRSAKTDRFYETYRTPLQRWRRAEGFTQKDYALRNASWHVTDIFAELKEGENRREGFLDEYSVLRDGPDERVPVDSTAAQSREIKHVAKTFGADLVGITDFDERWVYTRKYSRLGEAEKPQELPSGLTSTIVIAQSMDHGLIETVPSALSGTATGLGYSRDTLVLLAIAQYIRNLGYRAVASMNDTALAIPLAIKTGLGEYGRHGLLITKEFGPRVRLGKIFTDLPLDHDQPIRFGVKEFCDICRQCSSACPCQGHPRRSAEQPTAQPLQHPGASTSGRSTARSASPSGPIKTATGSICIRVCPFNKDFSKWYHRIGRRLAGTRLRGGDAVAGSAAEVGKASVARGVVGKVVEGISTLSARL